MENLAAACAAGNFPPSVTPARAFFIMGDSPFFTTSASEFFIPLARAVFMTSETSPSPPRAIPMPRFMSPACCARPLARLPGFAYIVGYVPRGQAPCLLYAAPQYAGLSFCRGSRRGEFLPACKASEVTEGAGSFEAPEPRRSNIGFADIAKTGCTHRVQSSRWRKPSVPVHRRCTVP